MPVIPSACVSVPTGVHTQPEYDGPGYSPCGKYVSHPSNQACNTIEIADTIHPTSEEHNCSCRSESCVCGDFISHKIDVVCPIISASWVGLNS